MRALCLTFLVLVNACGGDSGPIIAPPPPPPDGFFVNGDVQLSHLLDLPAGPGSFPAIVLVHGAGRVTKGDLRPLSTMLVQRGFAVLSYDKRGVGNSTGTYEGVSVGNSPRMIPDLASDVAAGVRFLKARSEIDPGRIGVMGGSQAGWTIPVAATLSADIHFAVVLSGPTVSVGLEIFYSTLAEHTSTPLEEVLPLLETFDGPHGFDPLPYLEQVTIPMLWLYGAADRSIPTAACVAIHDRLIQTRNPPFTIRVYPGAGHGLIPEIWNDIDGWLAQFAPP